MAANGISTLATKELRQKAKLDLVALKRQGNMLNSDGTVYAVPLGSAEFTGSNYLATAGGAGTAMGTGDFTWECWVRPTTSSGYQTFIDTRGVQTGYSGVNSDGAYFGLDTDTLFPVYYRDTALMVSSIAVTQNAWTHVALVRNSGTTTLYVGGVSGGTYADSGNFTAPYVNIGATLFDPGLGLTGQISNLRIVKGRALYTADFTPPTTTLTAVEGTQLLLLNGATEFVDGSANQFTITSENGSVTLSTTVPTLTISVPFYRARGSYDITQLPTQYNDGAIIDNPNSGGLVQGRPWITTVSAFTFYEAIGSTTAITTTQYVSGNKIYAESSTYDVPSFQPARVVVNDISLVNTELRGHTLVVLDSYGDVVTAATQYDTYIDPGQVTALASALNSVATGSIVVLVSYDASAVDAGLRSAINTSYGSTNNNQWTPNRYSHIFIGVKV